MDTYTLAALNTAKPAFYTLTECGGIDFLTDLYKMQKLADGTYRGFMCPNNQCGIFAYERAALFVLARATPCPSGLWSCIGIIASVDDDGLTFFHPEEEKQKAEKRLIMFVNWVNSCRFICPDEEEVQKYCKSNMGTAHYW